jgi:serine protease Do
MSKKSVLAALFLIFIGIIFGVILVSNFTSGIMPGFASDPGVTLGGVNQIKNPNYKELSKAFIDVSKAVSPTVVSISVMKGSTSSSDKQDLRDFFYFFSPKTPTEEVPHYEGGSGFVISPEGYIMTNNHVVENANENKIEVTFNDGRKAKAKVIGTDPTTDLAVIKVEMKDISVSSLGNSDEVEIGEMVLAIGNPLGLQGTVTSGIVSATGRAVGIINRGDVGSLGIENFIQTDAAINPGNSGGPLVNLSGEVIGINTAIQSQNGYNAGYGFAIPINLAKVVAEDLIKVGKVRRGYLGVLIRSFDETMAKALGLEKPEGALIETVEEDGAAMAAGIKEGDVILGVDGKDIRSSNELQSLIARKHPGDEVKLKIYRDRKTMEKTVTLRSKDTEKMLASNKNAGKDDESEENQATSTTADFKNLGMKVRALTSEEKKEFGVENGVLIAAVERFREASENGLQANDIILEADRQSISGPKDLQRVLDKFKPGDAVLLRVKRAQDINFFALQIPKE